jgi:hypothetical protein
MDLKLKENDSSKNSWSIKIEKSEFSPWQGK